MMRIITGKARGVKLCTLQGEETRPTAERTKEAVFSMIQFELTGKQVLDAFAGSGQMGLEALSRGASRAMLVDKNKAAVEIIKKNVELTRMKDCAEVACGDVTEILKRRAGRESYGIIFLDPPYKSTLIENTLKCLVDYKLIAENAIVVCESGEPLEKLVTAEILEEFNVIKTAKYGIAHITILKFSKEGNEI